VPPATRYSTVHCIADNLPCLLLCVDIGKKKTSNPLATSGQQVGNQWVPKEWHGAASVYHSVPLEYQSVASHTIGFECDGVCFATLSKCTWYYRCWTTWSSILRAPNGHTVEQCFIANAPICSNLHLVLQAWWYWRCITLHPTHLPPTNYLQSASFLLSASWQLFHPTWGFILATSVEHCLHAIVPAIVQCAVCSLTAFLSTLGFALFVKCEMQLVLCTQSKCAGCRV